MCVIDTGIDYYHPAFDGAFLTSSPAGNSEDLINGYFYGRNFIDEKSYNYYDYLTKNGKTQYDPHDPMETTYARWLKSGYPEFSSNGSEFYTDHGTHVSGTIASRAVASHDGGGSLGIAPDAKLFVYRALGPYGSGQSSTILAAINMVATDRPDVVNMSLGSDSNAGFDLQAIAVNNLMLAYDVIFCLSSGNNGRTGMYTVGRPGVSSAAITVGAAAEPEADSVIKGRGYNFVKGYQPLTGSWYESAGGWATNDYQAPDTNGEYELLTMPYLASSGITGTSIAVPGLGSGSPAEWSALLASQGLTITYPSLTNWITYLNSDIINQIGGVPFSLDEVLDFLISMYLYENIPGFTYTMDYYMRVVYGVTVAEVMTYYGVFGYAMDMLFWNYFDIDLWEVYYDVIGIYLDDTAPSFDDDYDDFCLWFTNLILLYGSDLTQFFSDFDYYSNNPSGFPDITDTVDLFNYTTLGKANYDDGFVDPTLLDNKFIVLGRGQTFQDTHDTARKFGAAGVILVNRANEAALNMQINNGTMPVLLMQNPGGIATGFVSGIAANNMIMFTLEGSGTLLTDFSSRGPVGDTYEIKPDIVAHGYLVLSTAPEGKYYDESYTYSPADDWYKEAYQSMSGTSMSSPNMAGEVALMKCYNPSWSASEIKSRLMNTAEPLDASYSVYETGSGYGRVDLAAKAGVWVAAEYDRVFTDMIDDTVFGNTLTGSLSFGGVNLWTESGSATEAYNKTITVTVTNTTPSAVTYSLSAVKNTVGPGVTAVWPSGASVTLDKTSVTAPAFGSAVFSVTLAIPGGLDVNDEFQLEGWVKLDGGSGVINMPFAAMTVYDPAVVSGQTLIRDVISAQDYKNVADLSSLPSYDYLSSVIAMEYTPWQMDVFGVFCLFDAAKFDMDNWDNGAFMGIIGNPQGMVWLSPYYEQDLGDPRSIYLGDGYYYKLIGKEPERNSSGIFFNAETAPTKIPDGDYVIAWENWEIVGAGYASYMSDYRLPETLTVSTKRPNITITSKREDSASGTVTGSGSKALFALAEGASTAARVPLSQNGSFTYLAPDGVESVTFYAVDEYEPLPLLLWLDDEHYIDDMTQASDDLYPIDWEYTGDGTGVYVGGNVKELKVRLQDESPYMGGGGSYGGGSVGGDEGGDEKDDGIYYPDDTEPLLDKLAEDADELVIDVEGGSFGIADDALELVVEADVDLVLVFDGGVTMTIDTDTLVGIYDANENGEPVFIVVNEIDDLAAGDGYDVRLAYNFTVFIGDSEYHGVFYGEVKMNVPYEPDDDEDENAVVVWYMNDGKPQIVRGYCENGEVHFSVKHFSDYAIGYNYVEWDDFGDAAVWAKPGLVFIAARGIDIGVVDGLFNPTADLTRGMFTANLMKAFLIPLDPTATSNFRDVNGSEPYADWLATAKKMGLVSGSNAAGTEFAPERTINRSEMFALAYKTLDRLGALPETLEGGRTLASFNDGDQVHETLRDMVDYMIRCGVLSGDGVSLNPKSPSSKQMMGTIIMNLIKSVR